MSFREHLDNCKKFVINLDDRSDKYRNFRKETLGIDLQNVVRYSALSYMNIDRDNIPYPTRNILEYNTHGLRLTGYEAMTLGQIGCCLTHLQLMEQCVKDQVPYFVLEDDAIFCDDFWKKAEQLFTKSQGKDLIMVGHNTKGSKLEARVESTWCTHAMLYTPRFAQDFIDYVNEHGFYVIDILIKIMQQEGYKGYIAWINDQNDSRIADADPERCGGLIYQSGKFCSDIHTAPK